MIQFLTVSDFCKSEYGEKLYKISFNANMGCPNRDGTVGTGGCIFCSEGGSGDFAVNISKTRCISGCDIDERIEEAKKKVASKYKGDRYIAYFQAYTNTYADVDTLRSLYLLIINRKDIAVLSIATRPDCITDDIYDLLRELNNIKPVWVELGLQTTKRESIDFIRRGYETEKYDEVVKRLNEIGIHTITHVILYLPNETKEDMLNTVRHVVDVKSKGIKLQLLHILEGTDLAKEYKINKIEFPSLEEYVETLRDCLSLLPKDMVVHRMTGDPPKKLLIEPKWSADKKRVLNAINNMITKLERD